MSKESYSVKDTLKGKFSDGVSYAGKKAGETFAKGMTYAGMIAGGVGSALGLTAATPNYAEAQQQDSAQVRQQAQDLFCYIASDENRNLLCTDSDWSAAGADPYIARIIHTWDGPIDFKDVVAPFVRQGPVTYRQLNPKEGLGNIVRYLQSLPDTPENRPKVRYSQGLQMGAPDQDSDLVTRVQGLVEDGVLEQSELDGLVQGELYMTQVEGVNPQTLEPQRLSLLWRYNPRDPIIIRDTTIVTDTTEITLPGKTQYDTTVVEAPSNIRFTGGLEAGVRTTKDFEGNEFPLGAFVGVKSEKNPKISFGAFGEYIVNPIPRFSDPDTTLNHREGLIVGRAGDSNVYKTTEHVIEETTRRDPQFRFGLEASIGTGRFSIPARVGLETGNGSLGVFESKDILFERVNSEGSREELERESISETADPKDIELANRIFYETGVRFEITSNLDVGAYVSKTEGNSNPDFGVRARLKF